MLVETKPERRIRVLLLPWLAHGHASAFLELGKRLMKRNVDVYYCSTPANLKSIKPKIPKDGIEVVELHLPSSPELPPHYHTTNGLPPHLMPVLMQTVNGSSSSIRHLLSVVRPDFFIYDLFPSCSSSVAHSLGIPAAIFFSASASAVSLSIFPDKCIEDYPFYSDSQRGFAKVLTHGAPDLSVHSFALIKTFRDIEGKFLDYMETQTRVLPLGPLVEDLDSTDDKGREILQWLDKQEEASTIYVSFGSECYLSKEEIKEVAAGLEKAEASFLWVLRFHDADDSSVEDVLPIGFLDRIGERGKIVEWAPQAKVLEHRSVGGFVSHCGWASLMESMKAGVPIIGMPMLYDQPINSKLVADVGVGIQVKRGEDGSIVSDEVAKAIRTLMVDQTERIREKAAKIKQTSKNNGDVEMDNVVKEIRKLCVNGD